MKKELNLSQFMFLALWKNVKQITWKQKIKTIHDRIDKLISIPIFHGIELKLYRRLKETAVPWRSINNDLSDKDEHRLILSKINVLSGMAVKNRSPYHTLTQSDLLSFVSLWQHFSLVDCKASVLQENWAPCYWNPDKIDKIDWLIDFKITSTYLGIFHAYRLENCIPCLFIFIVFVQLFLKRILFCT